MDNQIFICISYTSDVMRIHVFYIFSEKRFFVFFWFYFPGQLILARIVFVLIPRILFVWFFFLFFPSHGRVINEKRHAITLQCFFPPSLIFDRNGIKTNQKNKTQKTGQILFLSLSISNAHVAYQSSSSSTAFYSVFIHQFF